MPMFEAEQIFRPVNQRQKHWGEYYLQRTRAGM